MRDLFSFDPKTGAWSRIWTKGISPGPRDCHSATIIGRKMYLFGGNQGDWNKADCFYFFDFDTKEWSQISINGKLPRGRESHSATVFENSKILFFGGSTSRDDLSENEVRIVENGRFLRDVFVFSEEKQTIEFPEIKGRLPRGRDGHSAVLIGSRLVTFGGDCGDHYLDDVETLNLSTWTWEKVNLFLLTDFKTKASLKLPGGDCGG